MWSYGTIPCASQTFTIVILLKGLETSSCLEPIKRSTLKLGMFFASQVDFMSKDLIMTKSLILYWVHHHTSV